MECLWGLNDVIKIMLWDLRSRIELSSQQKVDNDNDSVLQSSFIIPPIQCSGGGQNLGVKSSQVCIIF